MDTRGQDFYGLVEKGMFGKDMITYINDAFADLYGTPTAKDFSYDTPQNDFTYEFLEMEYGVSAMATYTDIDSHAKPQGYDEFNTYSGKIATFKRMEVFSRSDMRRFMQVQNDYGMLGANDVEALNRVVFNTFDDLLQSNQNLVAFQRDQAVSLGAYEVTAANNPGSPFAGKLKFDYRVPSGNYKKAGFTATTPAKWWDYNATTGAITNLNASADPLKDLIDLYYFADTTSRKMVGAFEMSKTAWYNFWNHPSVAKQVLNAVHIVSSAGTSDMAQMLNTITPEQVQNWLAARGLPPIVVTDNKYVVKDYDEDKRQMASTNLDGFSSKYVVLRPANDYGIIKTARPLPGQMGNPNEVIFNGRTLITREYDSKEKVYWTETEESSLAILTKPSSMFYLEPGTAHS